MIRRFPDAPAAAQACARAVAELVSPLPRAAIAVSGGSSPKLMFQELARLPVDWNRVHIFWVDERGVPPDHEQSNYRMTAGNLLRPAGIPESNVHRIPAELEPHQAAEKYAANIRDFFAGAEPVFDLVHMGIGTDSHTASLFPGEPLTADRAGLTAAVYVPKMSQWRITLLPRVLLSARHCFLLAAGADKKAPLRDVLEGPLDPAKHPAQIVLRLRDAECFLDEAAAP